MNWIDICLNYLPNMVCDVVYISSFGKIDKYIRIFKDIDEAFLRCWLLLDVVLSQHYGVIFLPQCVERVTMWKPNKGRVK